MSDRTAKQHVPQHSTSGGGDNLQMLDDSPKKTVSRSAAACPIGSNGKRFGMKTPEKSATFIGHRINDPGLNLSPMKCRRALSMENLSPQKKSQKDGKADSKGKGGAPKGTHSQTAERNVTRVVSKMPSKKFASQRIYQVLTLNAWRSACRYSYTLNDQNKLTARQAEDFQLQIEVLMQFLNSEKQRMGNAALEIQGKAEQLENSTFELETISNMKCNWEKEVVDLEIKLTKMLSKYDSDVEDFQQMQESSLNKEKQLNQERNQLERARKEKNNLDLKIIQQGENISNADQTLSELQLKISTLKNKCLNQTTMLATTTNEQERVRDSLQVMRTENRAMLATLNAAEKRRNAVLLKIKDLDSKIKQKSDDRNATLQILTEKEVVLAELRRQLTEYKVQEIENLWSSRLRIISSRVGPALRYILTQQIS